MRNVGLSLLASDPTIRERSAASPPNVREKMFPFVRQPTLNVGTLTLHAFAAFRLAALRRPLLPLNLWA